MTNRLEYVQLSDLASIVNANNSKPFSAGEIDWVLQVRVTDILLCSCNELECLSDAPMLGRPLVLIIGYCHSAEPACYFWF